MTIPQSVFGQDSPVKPQQIASGRTLTSKARALSARTLARSGRQTWIHIMDSGSMKPIISGACRGLVDWSGVAQAQSGDIVIIDDEIGMLLSHRLIRYETNGLALQIADAIDVTTPYSGYSIPSSRILGRVVCIERRGRLYHLDTSINRAAARLIALCSESVWKAVENRRSEIILRILINRQQVVRRGTLVVMWCKSRRIEKRAT